MGLVGVERRTGEHFHLSGGGGGGGVSMAEPVTVRGDRGGNQAAPQDKGKLDKSRW